MSRRVAATAFGLVIGFAAWLLLPGHATLPVLRAAFLSLAGAFAGEVAAEWLFPTYILRPASAMLSALGALALLLAYGVVIR